MKCNDAAHTFPDAREAEERFGINSWTTSTVPLHEGRVKFRRDGTATSAGNRLCLVRRRCIARQPWTTMMTTSPPLGSRQT